jgi:TonB family protein
MDVIMGLPKEELRAVLLHERAHVHRLDSVTDGFLAIVMAAFYFYPPLWLISRWLRESAEYACDQAAVQAGVATETYTHALARTLSLQLAAFSGPAALSSHRSSLRERFNRLDEPWRYVTMTKHRLILALSVACTIVISVAVVLFAKTSVDKPDGPTAPSTPGEVAQGYAAAPDTSSPPPASPERFDMDLDSMPEIIQATYVLPKYPEEAKKAGVEAKAMLDVFIKADGTVSYAEVAEEISGYPEFGTNAVEAVRQWKFKPAIVDGSPVAVWVKIPFAYTLDEKKTRLDAKEEAGPGAAAGAESQGESKSIEGELKAPVEGKGQKPAVSEREGEVVVESHVSPKYPEDAKKAGVEGRVLVEVEVLKDGTVGRATVKEGIEGYASLGKSAVEALSKWRFRPVLKDGKPIDTTVCVPVEFKLQDKGTPATK